MKNETVLKLRKKVDYLQAILNSVPGCIYWKDKNGVYLGCNPTFLKNTGLQNESELIGKTDDMLCWQRQFASLRSHDAEVFNQQKTKTFSESVDLPDGSHFICSSVKAPLKNKDNKVIGIIGNSIDVAIYRENESRLKAANVELANEKLLSDKRAKTHLDNFERIIAFMPGSVYWKNTEGVYIGCNNAMADMFALPKSQILGKTDYDLLGSLGINQAQIEYIVETDKGVMESGVPRVNIEEPTFYCPNGQVISQISNKVPLFSETGEIAGILGISIDVPQRKELQQQLAESRAREARFKTLSSVGGMIAHELRTPLASLDNMSHSIQKFLPQLIAGYEAGVANGVVGSPMRPDLLDALKLSLEHMSQVVGYAQSTVTTILAGLHYSSTNRLSDKSVEFLLKDIVEEALEQYPFQSGQRDLIDASAVLSTTVFGEPQIVTHVIHNLLKNSLHAIDAADKGKIILESIDEGDQVRLLFSDTAQGIKAEHLPHVFEPFYTTKGKSAQSVGLGLYFCKMALQRMAAEIECESEWGHYVRFTITLVKNFKHG